MTAQQELQEALRVLAQGQVNLQALVQAQGDANRAHREEVAQLRAQASESTRLLQEQIQRQNEDLRRAAETKGRGNLLDTKGLGKPSTFSGQVSDWEAWSFKFVTWMTAQFRDAEKVLDWAASQEGAITPDTVDEAEVEFSRTEVASSMPSSTGFW